MAKVAETPENIKSFLITNNFIFERHPPPPSLYIWSVMHTKLTTAPAGIRRPYIRVVGLEVDTSGPGRSLNKFTPEEEDHFKKLVS
jgi:hypothetical protein